MADSDILRGADYVAALNLDGNQAVRIRSAARAMGMSEQEALKMIASAERKINRGGKSNTPIDKIFDAFIKKGDAVGAVNAEMPADIDGYTTVANDVIEYGENYNTDTSQQFGGIDKDGRIANVDQSIAERAMAAGKRDPNVFFTKDRQGNIIHEEYVPDGQETPDRFKESEKHRDFGLNAQNNTAPAASVMLAAQSRLQSAVDAAGPEGIPGAYDVIGKLEDSIKGNSEAEQSLAREMVRRDALNVNPDVVKDNELIAYMQARMADNTLNRSAPVFDQMGNISKLGHAKVANDFNVNIPVPGRETEPTSLPITTPETLNSPVTDNRYAGPLQKQEQWLVDNAPGFREGGSFNDYPQVAIGQQLNDLNTGLGRIRIGGQGIDPALARVRGIDDLQAAVDAVLELGAEKGKGFTRFEDGKNVHVSNPGITEVLQKAGYNANRTDGLARALFAVEAGRRNPANQNKKELFAEGISGTNRPVEGGATHEALGGGSAAIARAGRQKTGGGREVAAVLQALQGDMRADTPLTATELADARRPYIGAAEGDVPRRAQFLSAEGAQMSPMERETAYGSVNAAIANKIEARATDARLAREASLIPSSDPTSAAFRARDDEFEQAGKARVQADSRRALLQAAEDQGKSLVGKGQRLLGGQIVNGGMTGRNIVPESITGRSDAFMNVKSDPVIAQSVAPMQESLSGISYNETAPDPWQTPPATGSGITEEVARRAGPTQGPRTPGVRDKIMNSIKRAPNNFRSAPRRQRYGAAAGSALLGVTGLSGLFGGGNDDQEIYQ